MTFFFLSLSRFLHTKILHFLIASSVQIINEGSPILDEQVTSNVIVVGGGWFMGSVCDYLLIYLYTGNQKFMQMK